MQTINLDITNKGVIPAIYAKQGDVGRKFRVVLSNQGSPYNPAEGSLFSAWYYSASGAGNYTEIGDRSAFSVSGNEVTVELITQMLNKPGDGLMCLVLNSANGKQVGLWNIPYICERIPGAGSEAAEQYFTAFSKAVANIKDGISATHSWDGTTLTVTSASGSSSADLKGEKGEQGIQGIQGETGADGAKGEKGDKGDDGKSAYQYAKDGGFEGTEEEFAEKMASSSGYPAPCVMDYGAKGDGSTDDTVAFQTALAENRVVFVPGGTYKLSGELLIRGNCELELCQDTVLDFTRTSGNCVSMEMSASIRGHHGLIKVPYAFAGNVINVTTALNEDVTAIVPWNRWDPMWKAGRYITDLNITKHDSKGFCYANQPGDCKGTAIYISADRSGTSANRSTFIWGLDFSGIRIAGAFSYGIRAVNYNEAWNHEMRIAAFITNCEIGVSLEDCNNAYISAAIEPRYAEDTSGKITGVYAKHGIQLVRSTHADLTGSRVWDWNATGTLWTDGGQYQHIGMYGDCHGAILNSFEYYEGGTDIRKLIYTDTASNLEKLTILQEPITRWFKPKDNKPYFFDGDTEKELTYKEEFDRCFVVGKTPTFTDVLAKAIDTDGSIYNGIGYSRNGGCINGSGAVNSTQTVYGHTGFIAVKAGSTVRVEGIKLTADGDNRIAMYDASFNLLQAQNAANIIPGKSYWFPNYVETENGFSFKILAGYTQCAYIRLSFLTRNIATDPLIAINEEIGYTMEGYLADSIKVKGNNVVGGTGGSGSGVYSWNDLPDRPFYSEPGEVLPETTVEIDPETGFGMLPDMTIFAGDECTIKYNGTEYVCVCAEINADEGYLALGNYGVLDEENPVDTGEPFALLRIDLGNGTLGWGVVPLDGSTSVTLSVIGEVHHPVPDKYLPYKIVDINISAIEAIPGEISYIHDMPYALVREYALMPQTLVRCIVNDGTGKGFFNLHDITDDSVSFERFRIESRSGNVIIEEIISLYADGRCTYMQNVG